MKQKYLFHCKKCGAHKEFETKDECNLYKKQHRRCEFGFIPLVNGTKIMVREDIAADYQRWVQKMRRLDDEDRAKARAEELAKQGDKNDQEEAQSDPTAGD